MKILTLGKLSRNKDEMKATIEKLGGKLTGTASKASLCISTKKEVEKMSKKMEEVREAGVRVVSEDFLQDASASASSLQDLLSAHVLAPWGADVKAEPVEAAAPKGKSGAALPKKSKGPAKEEGVNKSEKRMKLTLKGGAAVDPDSGLEHSAHVLEKGGKVFSATLGLVDIVKGTNSYYKLQLLEDDKESRYWIFRSWGRVGTVIGSNKLEQVPSKDGAIEHFMKLYEEKTGNAWQAKTFTKFPKKFYPLEIDYGQVIAEDPAPSGCSEREGRPGGWHRHWGVLPDAQSEHRPFPNDQEGGALPSGATRPASHGEQNRRRRRQETPKAL
uniref:poly [ADP-ribose] polymerase 1-like n=1 Tax=Panthera onca TaxID=9690 RepID=UPI0029550795|nr:poly [ADP-ribose] polymerase 1-like [Panthera onca]